MLFKFNNEEKQEEIRDWSAISEYCIGHINTRQKVDVTKDMGDYKHGPRIKIPNRGFNQQGNGVSVPIIVNRSGYYDYDEVIDHVSVKKVGDASEFLPLIAGFAVFNQKELKTLVTSKDNKEKTEIIRTLEDRWIEYEKKYTKNGGSIVKKNDIRKDANKYAEDMNKKK